MNLENAVVYDIETFPNVFTLHAELLNTTDSSTWEISEWRDDRQALLQWFDYLQRTQTPMVGFYSEHFDYVIIHFIMKNPNATVEQIYQFAMTVINEPDRFKHTIWQRDRFAPQIDLFKIQHFDNRAKTTSLKALQINMRSANVVDVIGTEIQLGTNLTRQQVDGVLIPYNIHDVKETKKFAHYTRPAIDFRIGLIGTIPGDVTNFNDTKIGAKLLETRLGEDVCYDRDEYGRKVKRQTFRSQIALDEIIFPYIYFNNPEFARVLDWMRHEKIVSSDITDPEADLVTKGAFKGVVAHVGGMDFHFGTGGIHGSVPKQFIQATEDFDIRDIDVKALYPNIAIVNGLYPEHLGEAFVAEYARLPQERAEWQAKKGAKCIEANSMKLASNGSYGNSNSKFSVFYDPKFTMTITINGQLLLCMLAEWLLTVPTLQFIQINTDGITYKIHKDYVAQAEAIQKQWEDYTLLVLESVDYSRIWIRDVNNYVAEDVDGKLKQKGAYWHPDLLNYADSISQAGPPAWHKDFNPTVVTRAAVAAMTQGIDPHQFMRMQHDPFEFVCRVKVDKASQLIWGGKQIQGTSRYFIAKNGYAMKKVSPPKDPATLGHYKRANKLTDAYFNAVMQEIGPGVWDERIHTKNKSKVTIRETAIQAGQQVMVCNDIADFDFNNVNFDWYVNEAKKLIIT